MSDDVAALSAALAAIVGAPVESVVRLSGGASRETWAFDARGRDGVRPLILQRRRAHGRRTPTSRGDRKSVV